MSKTTVELPEELHRTLRVKAAIESRSMNELIVEAVRDHLGNFRVEYRGPEGSRKRVVSAEQTANGV